ncbi:MAG: DUF2155 domain-containing protein [Erythrobacter sp.]|nr:DUF2155 domain-containing protein [Erythrobacter sp.]
MRLSRLAALLLCASGLAACDSAGEPETAGVPLDSPAPAATAATAPGPDAASANGATPMAQRVATIGLLNKRNNVSQDITLKPGEARAIGPVIIRLSACERTAPWELPQETGAFVQVDIRERGADQHRRVFSGWLFRESPSLNVVEHPVYDVWVKNCAMRWPGEADSANPAPKPSGSPAPAPSATPSAAPAPAPAPAPAATPEA